MFVRILIGLSTLSGLILAPAANAWACSCFSSGPPCQSAFQVDAIFAGTVRAITPMPDDQPPPPPGSVRLSSEVRVEFADVTLFRGADAATAALRTAGTGAACGYEFRPGVRYLVYASRAQEAAGLVVSLCSRTRPLAEAAEDLRFLQNLSAPGETRPRVYGTITHWERELATGRQIEHGPVPDVVVSVRGSGRAFEGVTDANGRYEVTVPPGAYDVSAWPPARFSPNHLQRSAELPDSRSCAVADFSVRIDTRIRGSVREISGAPAVGVSVDVMAADSAGKSGLVETLHATTDAAGGFEITDASPGRYVVGVDLVRRMDPKIVLPRTYHPGTADLAAATIVDLAGGLRQLDPLTVPPPRRERRLSGVVLFADGRPASGAFISLSDGSARWRQVAVGIRTASDGTFSFVVHEGLDYIANASYWAEPERKQFGATVGPFVVTGEPAPLKIVLSDRR